MTLGMPVNRRPLLTCENILPHTDPKPFNRSHVPHHFVRMEPNRIIFACDECGCERQYGGGF